MLSDEPRRGVTTFAMSTFVKALVADDDRIVGFTIIGSVMAVVRTAMMGNLPYTSLR